MLIVTRESTRIEVPDGATVLQARKLGGKEIARFCCRERRIDERENRLWQAAA